MKIDTYLSNITAYLLDDERYKQTLRRLLKDIDLTDIFATYDSANRRRQLEAECDIIRHYKGNIDTQDLYENAPKLLKYDILISELHRTGGTRMDFLLAAIKNTLRCHETMLLESDLDRQECLSFIINTRRIADVRETLMAKQWYSMAMQEAYAHANESEKEIALVNKRITRILNTLNNPVLIVNNKGFVTAMNDTAKSFFAIWNFKGEPELISLLDFHFASFSDFVATYEYSPARPLGFTNGDQYLSELVKLDRASYLFSMVPQNITQRRTFNESVISALTQTENVVLEYINKGYQTKQIAESMNLSEDTIKTHRKNIRKKLGLVSLKVSIPNYSGD